jgi:DNA-binding CsgD family transcriptional regulator
MAGLVAGQWPMVGRRGELRHAEQALERTGAIVLGGAGGVGKTRLAREVLQIWKSSGQPTIWVAASRTASRIPFGAFATYLPILRSERNSPARDSIEVLLGARQAIREHSEGRCLLLAVDDAHFLDDASALLTFQLASADEDVAVAVTVHDGHRPPDAVAALSNDGIAERLELQPMSRAEIVRILEVALGGKVDGLLVEQAWEASAGNLLYLRELVEAAQEAGRMVEADGLWRLTGPLVSSSRLRELISARFANVGTSTRRALEVLAVGEPIDRQTLGLVADADGVEEGERKGLLEHDEGGTGTVVRLAHPLYGDVLRTDMPVTRRNEVTRRLAAALEKTGASKGEELLRYVLWRLDLHDRLPADLFLQAARRALEATSISLAEGLVRAGLEAGGGTSASTLLAIIHYRQGRGEEALADLAGIDPVGESQLTEIAVLRASVLIWIPGRVAEAEEALSDAEASVTDKSCRAWLAATRAAMLSFAGRPEEAVAIAGPLVEQAGLPPRPLLAALFALGRGLALSGRGDEAIRVAGRGFDPELRTADEVDGAATRAAGTVVLAHLCCGRLDQAQQLARLQYDTAMRLRSPEAQGPGAAALALIELLRGRVATAASLFREADLGLRTADIFGIRTLCLGSLAQALVMCGKDEAAADALSESERIGRVSINWLDWAVEVGRALLLARKDRAAAARLAMEAAETAEGRGQLPFSSWAYHAAVRIRPSRLAVMRLRAVAQRCDGPFPVAMSMRATGLIDRDPDGLLRSSEAFEELGMLLLAAEAAASAALLVARQGRQAGPLRERTRRLAVECEGAWSPALEDLTAYLAGLSPREMNVARFAGEGRSSLEIATLLGISVRTVDSHLATVYLKLGIGGRMELANALHHASVS